MTINQFDALTQSFGSRLSRRAAVRGGAAGLATMAAVGLGRPVTAQDATPVADQGALAADMLAAFDRLPGRKALRFWAPANAAYAEWSVSLNPDTYLFCASAFKAYVLAECLRQAEAAIDPEGETTPGAQLNAALGQPLTLDETVFSPASRVFNPPNLTGTVSARTTLEAMMFHSDNTATDMALKYAGADNVRAFIASIGLGETRIPESTRQFFGYVAGDPDWRNMTWDRVTALLGALETPGGQPPFPSNPLINDVISMVSSPADFVSFYARALQGAFFQYPETLTAFRAILPRADAIAATVPLGVNAFLKSGNADFLSERALTVAGGLWVAHRWVYFSFLINWTDDEAGPVAEVRGPFDAAANTMFTLFRDRLDG